MEIGLNLVPVPAADLVHIGERADALGFGGLYYGEHIAAPMELKTPYPGKVGYHAKVHQLECYVALGHLASVTRHVRLATGVSVLPIRHPLQTARAITTVDNVSNGRFDLVVGSGSIVDEYEVMGVDYDTRGARLDEWLDILDTLWREDEPSFDGRFMSFEPIGFEPKPIQKPRPPLYIGSHTRVGLRRAAKRADGWYGAVYTIEQMQDIKATLEGMLVDHGRDPRAFTYQLIHGAGVAELPQPEELKAYADAGINMLVLSPFAFGDKQVGHKLEVTAKAVKDYLP